MSDRLRDHAKAFDGLLSLIPAKMYYGEDTSDQWQRKKQTKEQAAAARRNKLDPDSELNRNAKEVMDERARTKRKLRELEQDDADQPSDNGAQAEETYEPVDGVEAEKPGEGLRKKAAESNKKQKVDQDDGKSEPAESSAELPQLSKREQRKLARKDKQKQTKAAKPEIEPTGETKDDSLLQRDVEITEKSTKSKKSKGKAPHESVDDVKSGNSTEPNDTPKAAKKSKNGPADKDPMLDTGVGFAGLQDQEPTSAPSSPASEPQSATFDISNELSAPNGVPTDQTSTSTSVASTVPPSEKPKHIKMPQDMTAVRARLAAKIEALRAARFKVDGPDGKPIRTRQELIESRRAKEAERKERKKQMRKQAYLEEARKREEALASNSPGVMSPAVELDEDASNFAFGRVAFEDGAQLSHDLSYVLKGHKKKGPSDPKTALQKVQNEKKRIAELDEDKRKDVTEKEAWLAARRRIEGEKVRDDENMLKKAVKRKESAKKKSEKAWKDRAKGVDQAQRERQRKREENLKKRRDEKLLGKAGKKKKKSTVGAKKKGGRPGFEGSFGVGGRKK